MQDCLGNEVIPVEESNPELAEFFKRCANEGGCRYNYGILTVGGKVIKPEVPKNNELCFCGNNRKFKKCCMEWVDEAYRHAHLKNIWRSRSIL
jgi:hypothetical protein